MKTATLAHLSQDLVADFPDAAAWLAHLESLEGMTVDAVTALCARVALPRPVLPLVRAAWRLEESEERARAAFRAIAEPTSTQMNTMLRRDATASFASVFLLRVAFCETNGSPVSAEETNALWVNLAGSPLLPEVPWARVVSSFQSPRDDGPAGTLMARLLAQKPGPPFQEACAWLGKTFSHLRRAAVHVGDAQGAAWMAGWDRYSEAERAGLLGLADHALGWAQGKPTRPWSTLGAQCVERCGARLVKAFAESGVEALDALGEPARGRFQHAIEWDDAPVFGWVPEGLLCVHNQRVLRGALWLATQHAGLEVPVLERAARGGWARVAGHGARAPAVALAAVGLLGNHADKAAAARALEALADAHKGKQQQKALAQARAGIG